MTAARDPYEVLGVPRDASTRQIRAAYVRRARTAHPDLVGQVGLDVMRALNEAWAVLKDVERRASYDAVRRPGATAAPAGAPAASRDPNAPFWTGAAGPPPGRPFGHVLEFGIYAGWSLGEISRKDRGYLQWLRDRAEAKAFRAEITNLLDPNGEPPPDPRRGRR